MSHEQQLQHALKEFQPITDAIGDVRLREEIVRLLTAEILARLALAEIDLEPYEQPDYEQPEIDMWEGLAQSVRSGLVSLLELKSTLFKFAPATEEPAASEDDIMFDLVENAPRVERLRDSLGEQVDAWLEATIEAVGAAKPDKTTVQQRNEVLDAIGPLAGIILTEINRFGTRLRNPNVVGDRWNLLADLQEFKGKFSKLLGAMRFGLLKPFTDLSEDALLKEYRTERETAQLLRRGVVGLTRDVTTLVDAHKRGNTEERRFIVEELLVRLMRFSRSEPFAVLRAPDKKVLIEFRKNLALNVGTSRERPRVIDELLEGFGKFLEVLGDINRREVLVRHDQTVVNDLRSRLIVIEEVMELDMGSALKLLVELRAHATPLYGRESMLDDWLNSATEPSDREDLRAITTWLKRGLQRVKL